MRSLSFLFTAVLLALTSAAPHHRSSVGIPIQKHLNFSSGGAVNLEVLQSHIARVQGKYHNGLAALQRNTGVKSPALSNHTHTKRGGGGDALTNEGIVLWYGKISVGTPPVDVEVEFDTGSADVFLSSTLCDQSCKGHTLYGPVESHTCVNLYHNFDLSYGDGSEVTGAQYKDTVSIAGLAAKNQTLGAALHISPLFQSSRSAADGLMGMGFSALSSYGAQTVMETLAAEGQLPEPVFAFKLASSGSELHIGGVNPSLYKGSFTYASVTQKGYWQINVDSMNINGQATSKNVPAVVDTGTTLILADTDTVSKFYATVGATSVGKGLYTMPCNAMPEVSITIGGKSFAISPNMFNLGYYDIPGGNCVGAIASGGVLGATWIVGDAFLRNVYTVFDIGNSRVGFADLA